MSAPRGISVNETIQETLQSPSYAIRIANGILDIGDFIATYVRWGQVFTAGNVMKNGVLDTTDKNGTYFNRWTHAHADLNSPLTPLGWGIMGTLAASLGVGGIRALYRARHEMTLNSYQYMQHQLEALDKRLGNNPILRTPEELGALCQKTLIDYGIEKGELYDINSSNKKIVRLKQSKQYKKNKAMIQQQDFGLLYANTTKIPSENPVLKLINTISNSRINNLMSYFWNWSAQHAIVFWVIWMPAAVIVGVAATMTLGPLLAVLVPTFIVGGIFTIWNMVDKIRHGNEEKKLVNKISSLINNQSNETDGADDKLKSKINWILKQPIPEKFKNKSETALETIAGIASPKRKAEVIALILNDLKSHESARQSRIHTELKSGVHLKYANEAWMKKLNETFSRKDQEEQADIPLSAEAISLARKNLRNKLLGTRGEQTARLMVGVANNLVGGFVITAFILWFASTVAALPVALGVVALKTTAAILGGAALSTYAGAAVGGWFSLQSFAQRRKDQIAYNAKIEAVLAGPKADELIKLHAKLNLRKAFIQADPTITSKLREMRYDLNALHPYNDYLFEKQKDGPNKKTIAKKIANRLFETLAGQQTGVFVARFLFLSGCLLAGALSAFSFGVPLAFIAIAAGLGTIVGGLRVAQYQLERNQRHRAHFAETIDQRIQYLKNKNDELDMVLGINGEPAEIAAGKVHASTLAKTPPNNDRRTSKDGLYRTQQVLFNPDRKTETPSQEKKQDQRRSRSNSI